MIGWDWSLGLLPAIQAFLSGSNPYTAPHMSGFAFVSPPWILPLIAPFGFLGAYGGYGMALVAVTGLIALCGKFKKPWLALLLAPSYPFLGLLLSQNVDGFVLWGLAIGGPIGFFLISIKPQVACFVGVVWVYQEYKRGGWVVVCKLVSPTLLVALIFTLRYPDWIQNMLFGGVARPAVSPNMFPWLLLPGIILVCLALYKRREWMAGVGTWLITPYTQVHSAVGAFVYVASENTLAGLILVIASWLFMYFTMLYGK